MSTHKHTDTLIHAANSSPPPTHTLSCYFRETNAAPHFQFSASYTTVAFNPVPAPPALNFLLSISTQPLNRSHPPWINGPQDHSTKACHLSLPPPPPPLTLALLQILQNEGTAEIVAGVTFQNN